MEEKMAEATTQYYLIIAPESPSGSLPPAFQRRISRLGIQTALCGTGEKCVSFSKLFDILHAVFHYSPILGGSGFGQNGKIIISGIPVEPFQYWSPANTPGVDLWEVLDAFLQLDGVEPPVLLIAEQLFAVRGLGLEPRKIDTATREYPAPIFKVDLAEKTIESSILL